MKSSAYWKKRFEQIEQAANNQGVQCYADIEKQYRQAQKQIESQISVWYQRFAKNNNVTLTDAKRMLNAKELAELKWDVNQYIQYGEENAINGTWVKQLENASARFHISRLEALKLQVQQSIEVMFGNQLDSIDSTMRQVYRSGYYHTAFEIQKGVGVGWDFTTLDDKQISKVINRPWAADGKNFSERVWGNRQKLVNELNQTLTQNIILGKDPQKAIDDIARKMKTSKSAAGRLVMTEEAFFNSAAQKDCFAELDVEQFEVVATLDSHTSDICREMDGKHFPMSQWEVGVTAPPFHVWCRSTTVPYFDDEFDSVGERAARDEETGKTYHVPSDMTYKQWQKSFVQGDKTGLQKVDEIQLNTIKFENVSDVNKYFGERPDIRLRKENREEYNRLRKEYENSPFGKWHNLLNSRQTVSISNYTSDDYHAINGVLRTEMTEKQIALWDSYADMTTMENIDNITEAISQFELSDNIQVYRTCEMDVFRNLQKNVGSIFIDDGFTSTSVFKTPVASGNVRMVIDVPSGKGIGAWISPLSGTEEEYEFLLQRGTKFRVDAINESSDEIQIHLTVIGNEPKTEITFASKEDVIQLWKEQGIYDEDAANSL